MKLINITLTAFLMLATFTVNAQWKKLRGSGNVTKQTRGEVAFTGIALSGSMNVKLSSGANAVEVEAEDNLQEYITTEIKNGVLHIGTKNGYNIQSTKVITIYVSATTISSVKVAGSGSVKSEGSFKTNGKLDVAISGSGSCNLSVDADETKARISGSGSIALTGNTGQLDVNISGSGSYRGYDMKSGTAKVSISGSGDVQTNISSALTAVISGSGSVLYKGAGDVSVRTSGSGRIRKMD